jgi:hypothetical protein
MFARMAASSAGSIVVAAVARAASAAMRSEALWQRLLCEARLLQRLILNVPLARAFRGR